LGGIRKKYRNCGLDALITIKMHEEARIAGLEYSDSHLTLEVNTKIRAEMERMEVKFINVLGNITSVPLKLRRY
jgi:hypothetical protein